MEVDRRRSALRIRGDGITTTLDRGPSSYLGYHYAVTPSWAGRTAAPLLVLGPPNALGAHQGRVIAAAAVAPAPIAREQASVRRPGLARDSPSAVRQWDRSAGIGIG